MYKVIIFVAFAFFSESNGQFYTDGTVPMSAATVPNSDGMGSWKNIYNSLASYNPYTAVNTRPSLPQTPNNVGPYYQEPSTTSDQLVSAVQWVAQSTGYPTAVAVLSRLPVLGKMLVLPVVWFLNLTRSISYLYKFPLKMIKALIFGY